MWGDVGIVHRGRGRPSNRRLPERFKAKVLNLCREKYRDFGPTLAAEKFGANAVIAVDLDYETIGSGSGNMLMVTDSGTAVKFE